MGAGAIGCYVGGRLAMAGSDVVFVGRARIQEELQRDGLTLTDVAPKEMPTRTLAPAKLNVVTNESALRDCGVILVCVKSEQTRDAGLAIARVAKDAIVVSLQNGLHNAEVLRESLSHDTVRAGIVGFNVVWQSNGTFRRATTGPLVIEASTDARIEELGRSLRSAGFQVELPNDIRPQQWSKLILNLNNAVSALTDAPTQKLVFDPGYRRIIGAVMSEALAIMKNANIRIGKLGPVPARFLPWMLRLPTGLLKLASRLQVEIDPEARSSMWEDLSRRRKTEVEHLNGEIVRLAASIGQRAPLNEKIVELIHRAEKEDRGSPKMTAEALWHALHST
jgi:2-dehydropantoate 2-reductase